MIGKVFIDLPDMEPSPFPLYIVFRGGGETRSINYILNDKSFDEDAKKHFADFFKLWYNSDLKEKLNSSGLDMTPEFLQFFWGGEFNYPVVMSLGSITVDRLIKWEAAVNFLTDKVCLATRKPPHEIEKSIRYTVNNVPAAIPILFDADAKNIITSKAGRNRMPSSPGNAWSPPRNAGSSPPIYFGGNKRGPDQEPRL